MYDSFRLVAPELILTAGAIILLLWCAWGEERASRAITWASVLLLAIASAALPGITDEGGIAFDGLMIADSYAAFSKVLIYIACAVSMVAALSWFGRQPGFKPEFPVLILLSAIGMGMMASAGDLLTLYIGLELLSLSSYVLAAFQRTDTRSAEAGLKYFVLGSLASGILLYGISLVYGFTGTTLFGGIAVAFGDGVSTGELFGMVLVLAGLAFKVSAVPFHMWTPDVYEGAPTPVTAYFSAAPKVAAMVLLVRVAIEGMGPAYESWRQIIIFMALASTVLGGVAAIGQRNIKRLLAYSSINNVGFALVGLAAGNQAGVSSVLFYMAVYTVMTLGTFLVVLRMRDADGEPLEDIGSLSGLSRTRPGLAWALMAFMFSLAGIPPLFGFWPKFLVFDAAVQADLTWLAAIAIATSVIGAYYYIKIVKIMFFDAPAAAYEERREPVTGGLIFATALFVSPLGYLLIPVLGRLTDTAAGSLF